jgi:hypothetical protein
VRKDATTKYFSHSSVARLRRIRKKHENSLALRSCDIKKYTAARQNNLPKSARRKRRAEGEQELEAACQVGDVFIVYSSN